MDQDRKAYWQNVYTTKNEREVSWFQDSPTPSLQLIEATGAARSGSIIDIGGGASRLVDALVDQGFESISVLDLSGAALAVAKDRLGGRSKKVEWIVADATTWTPARTYSVWHDRAAFHFLTNSPDKVAYISRMKDATAEGSHIILGTFALDGPERCSGLHVNRYDSVGLTETLGVGFELIGSRRHEHSTPWGSIQRFQFSTYRRISATGAGSSERFFV